MVAKCGPHRVWHWAHWKSKKGCDPWWEPETEWHRSSKNQFPVEWQEIGHTAQSGERHRADVKTETGLVLEFQYSALSEAERVSREEFYPRLVWVVHAARRLRDRKKFFASLSGPLHVASGLPTYTIHRDDSFCAIGERAASRSISTSARLTIFGDYIRLAARWLM